MEALGQTFGLLIVLALIIGAPLIKRQLRMSRIRAEWRARGQGFAEGRRIGRDIPIVAPHNRGRVRWQRIATGLLVVFALGWMLLVFVQTRPQPNDSVTVLDPQTTPTRAAIRHRAARHGNNPLTPPAVSVGKWQPTAEECGRLANDEAYRKSEQSKLTGDEYTRRHLECSIYAAIPPSVR